MSPLQIFTIIMVTLGCLACCGCAGCRPRMRYYRRVAVSDVRTIEVQRRLPVVDAKEWSIVIQNPDDSFAIGKALRGK